MSNPSSNVNNNKLNSSSSGSGGETTTSKGAKPGSQVSPPSSSSSPSSNPSVQLNEFLTETYENFFKFKNESLFTDVQIYVEGVEFPCHKVRKQTNKQTKNILF